MMAAQKSVWTKREWWQSRKGDGLRLDTEFGREEDERLEEAPAGPPLRSTLG